jgi:hypothetical protein
MAERSLIDFGNKKPSKRIQVEADPETTVTIPL